jgi:DNA-3-methyladenine glycosylase II
VATGLTPTGSTAAPAPPAVRARPPYWQRARRALSAADPVMARIVAEHPRVRLISRGDPFSTLARSIVGQQISVKAADAVWERLAGACAPMTPAAVLRRRATTLRACGLSDRKVEYIRDLAQHFASGRIDPAQFPTMPDQAVIDALVEVHGVGRWTAEMFLIFNLLRPDVLPLDDLGLLKAVGRHYLDGAPADELLRGAGRARVTALAACWAPWRSVATWYLWRSLDPVPVEY